MAYCVVVYSAHVAVVFIRDNPVSWFTELTQLSCTFRRALYSVYRLIDWLIDWGHRCVNKAAQLSRRNGAQPTLIFSFPISYLVFFMFLFLVFAFSFSLLYPAHTAAVYIKNIPVSWSTELTRLSCTLRIAVTVCYGKKYYRNLCEKFDRR